MEGERGLELGEGDLLRRAPGAHHAKRGAERGTEKGLDATGLPSKDENHGLVRRDVALALHLPDGSRLVRSSATSRTHQGRRARGRCVVGARHQHRRDARAERQQAPLDTPRL